MSKIELSEEEIERIKAFTPATVKRRKLILEFIVEELNHRNFRSLDEANKDDLQKVMKIVSDMYPESAERKIREYSEVAIRLWKRTKN
jgi:hypothetical protein